MNDIDRADGNGLGLKVGVDVDNAAASNYILVQTTGPLRQERKLELEGLKLKILKYVAENAYMCRYDNDDLSAIRAMGYVSWVNPYPSSFVVSPRLKRSADDTEGSASAEALATHGIPALLPPLSSESQRDVSLRFHDDVDVSSSSLASAVAQAAHLNVEDIRRGTSSYELLVAERYLDAISKLDEVFAVEEVQPTELHNNRARDVLKASRLSFTTNSINPKTYNLSGTGEIIAVADSGFDLGDVYNVHPAFDNAKKNRVMKLYPYHKRNKTGDPNGLPQYLADDPTGHGTHVCGSVLGYSLVQDPGNQNFRSHRGSAPNAKLVVQSLFSGFDAKGRAMITLPETEEKGTDWEQLFGDPYKDQARIHTNSYGISAKGPDDERYTGIAEAVDKMAHKYPELIILYSAGNDAEDTAQKGVVSTNQINAYAFAKNVITVGASENNRSGFNKTYYQINKVKFSVPPIKDDKIANNTLGMAAFSSRGPPAKVDPNNPTDTNDMSTVRIKPDVVAPGTAILSAQSRALPEAMRKSEVLVSQIDQYSYKDGTSMATPLVAGCCALIREGILRDPETGIRHDKDRTITSALVKALLINGCVTLKGQYDPSEAGASPNCNSGWGLVDISASLKLVTDRGRDLVYAGFYQGIGPDSISWNRSFSQSLTVPSEYLASFEPPDPERKLFPDLKVTLVWTDRAGVLLQNKLRLSVKLGQKTLYGNKKDGWTPVIGPDGFEELKYNDQYNTVQQVVWKDLKPNSGTMEIEVEPLELVTNTETQAFAVAWLLTYNA